RGQPSCGHVAPLLSLTASSSRYLRRTHRASIVRAAKLLTKTIPPVSSQRWDLSTAATRQHDPATVGPTNISQKYAETVGVSRRHGRRGIRIQAEITPTKTSAIPPPPTSNCGHTTITMLRLMVARVAETRRAAHALKRRSQRGRRPPPRGPRQWKRCPRRSVRPRTHPTRART